MTTEARTAALIRQPCDYEKRGDAFASPIWLGQAREPQGPDRGCHAHIDGGAAASADAIFPLCSGAADAVCVHPAGKFLWPEGRGSMEGRIQSEWIHSGRESTNLTTESELTVDQRKFAEQSSMNDSTQKWEEFLNPEVLRFKLVTASLYLTAFELLKDSIINRVEGLYTIGYDEGEADVSSAYGTEVLALNKGRLYASLLWLKKQSGINDADLVAFEGLRACRNAVAHQLLRIIAGDLEVAIEEQFPALVSLLRKIEVWWITNF